MHPLGYAALRYFNVAGANPQRGIGQATRGASHRSRLQARQRLAKGRSSKYSAQTITLWTGRACVIISTSRTSLKLTDLPWHV